MGMHQAIGMCFIVIIATSIFTSMSRIKTKQLNVKVSTHMEPWMIFGGFVGAMLGSSVDASYLKVIFSLLIFIMSLKFWLPKNISKKIFGLFKFKFSKNEVLNQPTNLQQDDYWDSFAKKSVTYKFRSNYMSMLIFCLVGFCSGLLGIGGGALMVPILVYSCRLPFQVATGSSAYLMSTTGLIGTFVYIGQGHTPPDTSILVCLGVLIGVQLGKIINRFVPTEKLKVIFGLVLLLSSLKMALQ